MAQIDLLILESRTNPSDTDRYYWDDVSKTVGSEKFIQQGDLPRPIYSRSTSDLVDEYCVTTTRRKVYHNGTGDVTFQDTINSPLCNYIPPIKPYTVSFSVTKATGSANTDGAIQTSIQFGSGDFTYSWSDDAGVTTKDRTGLGPAIYYLTITDNVQGKEETFSIDVGVEINTDTTAKVISERKCIDVKIPKCNNPVYLKWKNKLGGWDYWLFDYETSDEIRVQFSDLVGENYDYNEQIKGYYRQWAKSTDHRLRLLSQVEIKYIKGIRGIIDSPKIEMLVSTDPIEWVGITMITDSFGYYKDDSRLNVEFEIRLNPIFTVK